MPTVLSGVRAAWSELSSQRIHESAPGEDVNEDGMREEPSGIRDGGTEGRDGMVGSLSLDLDIHADRDSELQEPGRWQSLVGNERVQSGVLNGRSLWAAGCTTLEP